MSTHLLVAGITNLETSVRVEGFPLDYAKSRFTFDGITDRPGGVGFNVARGVAAQGVPVALATAVGRDMVGDLLLARIAAAGIDAAHVHRLHARSLRTTVLVDPGGRGAMLTDLRDSQQLDWPAEAIDRALDGTTLVHATNINWGLQFARRARERGIRVATDVHALRTLEDDYNRRFFATVDVLLLSGENLESPAEQIVARLMDEHGIGVVVCTLAERGALLGERDAGRIVHHPTTPCAVVNATGAGDAFAAAFLAGLWRGATPADAIAPAQIFAARHISRPAE